MTSGKWSRDLLGLAAPDWPLWHCSVVPTAPGRPCSSITSPPPSPPRWPHSADILATIVGRWRGPRRQAAAARVDASRSARWSRSPSARSTVAESSPDLVSHHAPGERPADPGRPILTRPRARPARAGRSRRPGSGTLRLAPGGLRDPWSAGPAARRAPRGARGARARNSRSRGDLPAGRMAGLGALVPPLARACCYGLSRPPRVRRLRPRIASSQRRGRAARTTAIRDRLLQLGPALRAAHRGGLIRGAGHAGGGRVEAGCGGPPTRPTVAPPAATRRWPIDEGRRGVLARASPRSGWAARLGAYAELSSSARAAGAGLCWRGLQCSRRRSVPDSPGLMACWAGRRDAPLLPEALLAETRVQDARAALHWRAPRPPVASGRSYPAQCLAVAVLGIAGGALYCVRGGTHRRGAGPDRARLLQLCLHPWLKTALAVLRRARRVPGAIPPVIGGLAARLGHTETCAGLSSSASGILFLWADAAFLALRPPLPRRLRGRAGSRCVRAVGMEVGTGPASSCSTPSPHHRPGSALPPPLGVGGAAAFVAWRLDARRAPDLAFRYFSSPAGRSGGVAALFPLLRISTAPAVPGHGGRAA